VNFLGYPGTLGAPFIDYIVADETLIPKDSQKFYSEKVIYLPHSYQVNDNTRRIADWFPSKEEVRLPETGFVFCCFNNNYKISPTEFNIWMRLLREVEGSALWLFKANPLAEKNLLKETQKRGIDPDRLVFAERMPLPEHLARHRLADLFLDTFNYNAHTTASDALWAGLPVLTKMGKGFAARVAGSLLNAIDLPELITTTDEAYENLALDLATNPQKLQAIKEKLLANRATKPLFDTALYTRHLEEAYRKIYDLYYEGAKPEHIFISDGAR
jgi:predicted O-linked N-acetylglucosamine transferase (SPINDLY family)